MEELDAEIAQLQKQIDIIRQVRRCKACGEVSPNTSRFCGACGAKFEEEQPPVEVKLEPEQEEQQAVPAEDGVEITWPQAEENAEKKDGE